MKGLDYYMDGLLDTYLNKDDMKTYNVELKRTSYITVMVEAENQDAAEEIAWLELGKHEHKDGDWYLESIEEIK